MFKVRVSLRISFLDFGLSFGTFMRALLRATAVRVAFLTELSRIPPQVDSYVVAKHMAHRNAWACKTKTLKEHYITCRALGKELTDKGVKWEVRHIYREYNQTADALANAALDDENGNGPSEHW